MTNEQHPTGTERRARRSTVPGPPTVPLLGWRAYALYLLGDPVQRLRALHRRYGDIVALGRAPGAPVCIFSPEYNHQVLTDAARFYCLDVTDSASPLRMPPNTAAARLLTGLTGMNGARHRHHRRLLLPSFQRDHVDMMRATVIACTERYLQRWHVGQQIDLPHEMVELSLNLAIEALLGLDPTADGQGVRPLLARWGEYGLSPQVMLLPIDFPGTPYRRFLRLADELESALSAVIASKREHSRASGDALSLLLQARDEEGRALSDQELHGHLTTLFTAGHETTASALTWILVLLALHPTILAQLTEQLDRAWTGDGSQADPGRPSPLLLHVIDEGLRMFPPGMWMVRTCSAPAALGQYELAAGTHVVVSPAVTHYRSDLFEDPHTFAPWRWETISPSPYEYLPFGNGPRRCLGATFALMELQLVLPLILRRFQPTIPPNTRIDRAGTVLSFPKGAMPIVLEARGHRFPAPRIRGNIRDLVNLPESDNFAGPLSEDRSPVGVMP